MKLPSLFNISLCLFLLMNLNSYAQISDLQSWLSQPLIDRPPLESLDFAKEPITQEEANQVLDLLVADKQAQMLDEYGAQWDNRLLTYANYQMPFYYQFFGEEPSDGCSGQN